ncbi:hypothetical protein [Streptosporangium sp. NBC_01469]|uniref:hypothetical protein n=1 Tax=Streptosporangium sp. NBC_01469 TaxID=2903898 RepID=UPI002E2988CF|nr:hypothetical protein [Streptosporangium sp. NBC_01469]
MEVQITDATVGELTLTLDRDGGTMRVEGDAIPAVVVRRSAEAVAQPHIPIGTRGPEHLTMTLDGTEIPLRPAPGRVTRHSYRAEVDHAGSTYTLVPISEVSSGLFRGKHGLGEFTTLADGEVRAEWIAPPSPEEAAIGYALAACFGSGAEHPLLAFFGYTAL